MACDGRVWCAVGGVCMQGSVEAETESTHARYPLMACDRCVYSGWGLHIGINRGGD